VLALTLLLAACAGDDDPGPTASVPTAASAPTTPSAPTTTTAGADPFAIPDVIDAAYVNRVLAALYAVDGDVVRKVIATNQLDVDDVARYVAIYSEPQRSYEIDQLRQLLGAEHGNFRQPPGDRRVTVSQIGTASSRCIFANVAVDFSQVLIAPPPRTSGEFDVIKLTPTPADADREDLNPTPWSVADVEVVSENAPGKASCG